MDVTSIVGGSQPQKNNSVERNTPARLRAVVDTVTRDTDKVLEGQTTAARLQAQETRLRGISGNLARASSLSQRAEEGLREVSDEVRRLRGAKDEDARRISDNIDRIVDKTTFEKKPLLDGSAEPVSLTEVVSGSAGGSDDVKLRLPDVSSRKLLGDNPTAERVDEALRVVDKATEEVKSFRKSAEVVAASIDTAIANQQASQAELRDGELDSNPLRDIRENRATAVDAQANRIPPALLRLVN